MGPLHSRRRLLNPLLILFTVGIACHLSMPDLVTRLLGFSAGLRQWGEVRLGLEERIERYHLLPFLILAHSNQEVQAFKTRADIGRAWPSAPARRPYNSGGPALSQPPSRMNAIGFSTYTGGFYDVDRTPNERVVSVDGGQNALVVRTSSRTLVLKSQSTGWTEVR